MDSINMTLYIPLYGKSLVSEKGIILEDKKAEEIWKKQKIELKAKSRSKWLAYYMGMRSAVFDKWVNEKISEHPSSVVLHLGCGLDSRIERVANNNIQWFDVDFDAVIEERRKYYNETQFYKMLCADIKEESFVSLLPHAKRAIVIFEGISMYLKNDELRRVLTVLCTHFSHLSVLIDCYTPFAAKMSKIRNPIKDVGASQVYGVENPNILAENTGLTFIKEHKITPQYLINQLCGCEKFIFKTVYAGRISKKLYKLYEYEA